MQYCGRECQNQHWAKHKLDCNHPLRSSSWQPTWYAEARKPAWLGDDVDLATFGHLKYLVGNVPAYDVLNFEENEGSECEKDLAVLFAGM